MYEYIADIERWKKTNKDYNTKYSVLKDFVNNCDSKCNKNQECIELCKKPIIDIEKFNTDMIKRASLDIYELCSNKTQEINELNLKISKMNKCVATLYQDNENIIKRELLDRIDSLVKFLNS
jgi:hypothetical protein